MRRRDGEMLSVLLLAVTWFGNAASSGGQSLQHLLRHPHYSQQGHRHHVATLPTQHSSLEPNARWADTHPTGSWKGVAPAPKEFYKPQKMATPVKTQKIDPSISKELWEVREANDHFVRMRQESRCGSSRPRVVRTRDVYPDKDLLPRCTVLHRCAEDTGCCEDPTLVCAPRTVRQVALFFYMIGEGSTSSVERLNFPNHTECECRPRAQADVAAPPLRCGACPEPFSRREEEDGRCGCDCFDKHRPCIRIKRGREPLADQDRRCVESGRCHVPDCEYGPFEAERGRCPKRPDNEGPRTKSHLPNHRNPNHRWTYFERD